MLSFIFLVLVAGLPILAYLLSNKTNNKGIVFGLSALVLSSCLFLYVSKFSLLGSLNKRILNNQIIDEIYIDAKIPTEYLVSIEKTLNEDEIKIWLISFISKAIEIDKLKSAESLVTFAEKFFNSNEEKIIFYNMYTSLRDAKFPEFSGATFKISDESYFPCIFSDGEIRLFILNGPDIPIGENKFLNQKTIEISNKNSLIPGFDLSSAYLNNETLELSLLINCDESGDIYSLNNLIALSPNMLSISYKIELNEWLKKPQ